MEIKTLEELTQPDERTRHFAPLGLLDGTQADGTIPEE